MNRPLLPHGSPLLILLAALVLLTQRTAAAPPEGSAAANVASPAGGRVDFERDVAAILESHCLNCHGAAEAQGDVRLDEHSSILDAITPGAPDASRLIEVISGPQPEMPLDSPPLSSGEVERLRAWIAAGAAWPTGRRLRDAPRRDLDWWSLRPLQVDTPPGGGHPVDAFIMSRLASEQLSAVGPAEPQVLLRRLSYDLTGLPPTPELIASFRSDGFERTVDRLLASPAFGEKWARHWLDVARYAETHGYDKDKPRDRAWPYRDYVIRAFNDDKPYDRFAREQIAGDALYPDQPDGVLGLGFLAAGPWDFIGHVEVGEDKVDGRIAKHLDRDEMISAVYNVFTSTTVQCAQCHHHKFDPVTMEDYYRLHAVFAAVDRGERLYAGLTPEQQRRREQLTRRRDRAVARRAELSKAISDAVAAESQTIDARIAELKREHGVEPSLQYGWHSQISPDPDSTKWVQVDLGEARPVDRVRLFPAYDTYAGIGAGFGFPLRLKVEAGFDADWGDDVRVLLDVSDQDQPNPRDRAWTIDVGGAPIRFIRVTATRLAERQNDYIFALGELEAVGGDSAENFARQGSVTASDSIEAAPRWGRSNLIDGIRYRELDDDDAMSELRRLRRRRDAIEAKHRTPAMAEQIAGLQREIDETAKRLNELPAGAFVYAAATDFKPQGRFVATAGKPRPIHLLRRGDITSPADPLGPGMAPLWPAAPAEFSLPTVATEADARGELAVAISAPENPLFWRSIVNRLWHWTFGKPLVGTPNDFGRMGMSPSHPELLDYLARRLRDDPDHSLKAIIRLLVTSEAYRRATVHDETSAARDTENTYLWRANRRRLTAEEYRDAVLMVSDRLDLGRRGGPSFHDFVIEKPEHSPHYQYHLHDPTDPASHRRSIYRFVVRSQPQPFLTALDCADPSLSVASRDESTTALQSLVQWNNRLVETMSRAFGERLAATADPIDSACRLALGRPATADERRLLGQHLREHGHASLARVIFNLNSFVYLD